MSLCTRCRQSNRSGATTCRHCGQPLVPPPPPPPPPHHGLWLSLEQVFNIKTRQWGLIGALLTFIGSFSPWAEESIGIMGLELGTIATDSPQSMLMALASLLAATLVFHRRGGQAVMVIGGIMLLSVIMFALGAMSSNPSWGLLLCAVGSGMVVYSGHNNRL